MYQKLMVVGNLGGPVELKYLPDGTPVGNFSMATNRKWDGGEETVWFRISVFGSQAEACEKYIGKGSQVLVEGRLKPDKETGGPRVWTDKQGNPRASFEVTAQRVKFLGGNKQEERVVEKEPEEEIPF